MTALGSEPPIAPTLERRWIVEDGLPHNIVTSVVQDRAGYLWLGTGAGLTRFDGRNFKVVPLLESDASLSFNIRQMVLEDSGSLLMLPASGGIVRFHDGKFAYHPASQQLGGRSLVDLFEEPDGTLWLGTEDEKLLRWHEGELAEFGPAEGIFRRGNRFTFVRDAGGQVWIAGGDFFGSYHEGKLVPYPGAIGTSVFIAPSRTGGVWITTFQRLLKLEQGRLEIMATDPTWPLTRSTTHALFEDREGILWIGTRRGGLFRYRSGEFAQVVTSSPQITALTEDREGNVWVSTDGGGLARIQPKAFVLLDRASGLAEDLSSSVCTDANDAIWCANRNGGLVRMKDGVFETVANSPVTAQFFAITVCNDRSRRIWVGATGGLFRTSIDPPHHIEAMAPGLPTVRAMFCASSGDMWVGAGDGALGYFHDDVYHEVVPQKNSSDKRMIAIAEAPDGSIWAATRDGAIISWHAGKLENHPPSEGRINVLHFDADGALWIGTPRGLQLRYHGVTRIFTRADGLPDDDIDNMIQDKDGRMWIGCHGGLFHVSLTALKDGGAGQPHLVATTFGRDEGLAGMSAFTNGQPRSCQTSDGHLWLVTHRGIVGLDPAALSHERSPPLVYIDSVAIDGHIETTGEPISVSPGNHRLDFNFVALNFSAPERVRVRHQLVGYDADWIETLADHTATYAHVPPGHYEMKVIACNQDGVWNNVGAAIGLVVAPSWWQTTAFAFGAPLVFILIVIWAVRAWSHRRLRLRLIQLEHENALERERARIARDLHDELGGSLTQIRLLTERMKRHSDDPVFKNFAAQLSARARRLASELESIIWTVSPKNNTWDRLASFMGQFALKFFRETSVICTVHGIDEIPTLPLRPEEQHNLLAFVKEAMNNTLKHAHATRVTLTFSAKDGMFSLILSDDGIGFDPQASNLAACNGLSNMRARVREIGGECTIESATGQGTRISLRHAMRTASPCPSP